jgi:transcriptional regulator with XRE-family HTH domain
MNTNTIVGDRIKSIRESKSMTVEQLAEKAGLTVEQIQRIENDIDLPSLSPLIKISHALEVRLGTFFDDQSVSGPVICRKDKYSDSISFSNNAIQSRKNMEYHSLSKSKTDRHMEPFIIDVAPTEKNDFVLSTHEGEEFIFVLEGTME